MNIGKILGAVAGAVVLGVGGLVAYVEATYEKDFSDVALPNITASQDPAVIEQGRYVAHALAHCSGCHGKKALVAEHDPAFLDTPDDLSGGYVFEAGPFGDFVAANLTSDPETGIGKLSDGQLARAIRHGVDRNGRYAAFMAFAVGAMSNEDLTAVVSYLRTLPPIAQQNPKERWGFLAKALADSFRPHEEPVPQHVVGTSTPTIERGRYLASGPAFCIGCHTATDPTKGFARLGEPFSGAPDPEPDHFDDAFELVSPNLTPDPDTGIMAKWTEEQFLERFKKGRVYKSSKMPWENFARMTESDQRSIYRFLRSLPPTKKDVGPSRRAKGWKPS